MMVMWSFHQVDPIIIADLGMYSHGTNRGTRSAKLFKSNGTSRKKDVCATVEVCNTFMAFTCHGPLSRILVRLYSPYPWHDNSNECILFKKICLLNVYMVSSLDMPSIGIDIGQYTDRTYILYKFIFSAFNNDN